MFTILWLFEFKGEIGISLLRVSVTGIRIKVLKSYLSDKILFNKLSELIYQLLSIAYKLSLYNSYLSRFPFTDR